MDWCKTMISVMQPRIQIHFALLYLFTFLYQLNNFVYLRSRQVAPCSVKYGWAETTSTENDKWHYKVLSIKIS